MVVEIWRKAQGLQGRQGRQLIVLLEMTMLSTSTSPPYARYTRKPRMVGRMYICMYVYTAAVGSKEYLSTIRQVYAYAAYGWLYIYIYIYIYCVC